MKKARMLVQDREYVKSKYDLSKLKAVEDLVADAVEVIKKCTTKIKAMADVRKLAIEDTDVIINQFYHNLNAEKEQPLLADLTIEEKKAFEKKELELNGEPSMQRLDDLAEAHTNGVVTDHASRTLDGLEGSQLDQVNGNGTT
ncbi:MAG: hypothetical protein Q9183_002956 [Haloplaca sp. 2 TL-2023]